MGTDNGTKQPSQHWQARALWEIPFSWLEQKYSDFALDKWTTETTAAAVATAVVDETLLDDGKYPGLSTCVASSSAICTGVAFLTGTASNYQSFHEASKDRVVLSLKADLNALKIERAELKTDLYALKMDRKMDRRMDQMDRRMNQMMGQMNQMMGALQRMESRIAAPAPMGLATQSEDNENTEEIEQEPPDKSTKEIEQEIERIQREISDKNTAIANMQTTTGNLQTTIGNLQTKIDESPAEGNSDYNPLS